MAVKKIDAIQAMRGVAALLVVARHCWHGFLPGGVGVDLFFIISGFTMMYASQRDFGSVGSIVPFLLRRALRIYPTYWVATALTLLVVDLPPFKETLRSILLVPSADLPIVAPGWTLIYEVLFYAIFALWIWLPMRRAALAIVATLIVIVFAWPHIGLFRHYDKLPISLEFGVGVLIGLAYCEGVRIGGMAAEALLGIGLLAIAATTYLNKDLGIEYWTRQIAWGVPCVAIFIALVFGPPVATLRHEVLQTLGDASYSIYLMRWMICMVYADPRNNAAGVFSLTVLFGVGFYFAVERPFLEFSRARFPAWHGRRGALAPAE